MPKKETKSVSPLEETMRGCYGKRIHPSEVKEWLVDNIMENIDRNPRITLDIYGAPGCVLEDTMITVKKISNDNGHRIFVKEK